MKGDHTPISASERVNLDRCIAESGCLALDPPFERPDWAWQICALATVPNAFVMDRLGAVSPRWVKADEVNWLNAVAVKFETHWGIPLSLSQIFDDEDYC